MSKHYWVCLSILLLLTTCCSREGAGLPGEEAIKDSGLFLTLEFHGAETRNWYRVGLATPDRKLDLGQWREANWIMREYFLASTITEEEADGLRAVLGEEMLLKARQSERPKALLPQQYVIGVFDKGNRYYVPVGLDSRTLKVVGDLRGALGEEASKLLERIVEQLSRLTGNERSASASQHSTNDE